MAKFEFTVFVETDTIEHAEQVAAERTSYDEQYADEGGTEYDYTIWRGEVTEVHDA